MECFEDGYGQECPVCDRPGGARTASGFCSRTCQDDARPLTVQVRERHLLSVDLESELWLIAEGDKDLISDAAAVTIAGWYQGPSGAGAVFAAFASGCEVEPDDLLDAIHREACTHNSPELSQLAAWLNAAAQALIDAR